jgi:DNA-binding transcriptional MocR family regulator
MRRHRAIIAPKFEAVDAALTAELEGLGIAEWTRPTGGYFVNLDVLDGTATRVVELAKQAGIALTPAGASFPHGHDPRDRNIRLAPTFPELAEVETAMAGVATCVALAAGEKLTAQP